MISRAAVVVAVRLAFDYLARANQIDDRVRSVMRC